MSNIGINAALVAALGELRNVAKNAVNPHFKNRYASLDAILDAARPVLAKHGLALSQEPIFSEGHAGVLTRIIHAGGECRESTLLLPLRDQSPQGVGSALTYARRYAVSSVLGIAADDDDDGQHASKPAPTAKIAAVKAAVPKAPAKDWGKELSALMEKDKVSEQDIFDYLRMKGAKVEVEYIGDLPVNFLKGLVTKWSEVVGHAFHMEVAA
jgi:hypothetical protein